MQILNIVLPISLRRCETRSQSLSLAPPKAPLKLSLLHSIVFHILSRVSRRINYIVCAWVRNSPTKVFALIATKSYNLIIKIFHAVATWTLFAWWKVLLSDHKSSSYVYLQFINWGRAHYQRDDHERITRERDEANPCQSLTLITIKIIWLNTILIVGWWEFNILSRFCII